MIQKDEALAVTQHDLDSLRESAAAAAELASQQLMRKDEELASTQQDLDTLRESATAAAELAQQQLSHSASKVRTVLHMFARLSCRGSC
jgi:hypothetical protein